MTIAQQLQEKAITAELESRLGIYRLFNRLLSKEVDQQLLDEMRSRDFADAINRLGLSLDKLPDNDNLLLEQLATEFTRLFLGPGKHVSPHESIQTKHDGTLNDETTAGVKQFIEATGFRFRAESKHYADHISSELEFMEALISIQIAATKDADLEEAETSKMLQEEFLLRHLAQWIPRFCTEVEQSAKKTLYSALARALSDFIQLEYASVTSAQEGSLVRPANDPKEPSAISKLS